MKRIVLREKEERRLLRGHLWIYRNELAEAPQLDDGQVVDVYSAVNRFVARGFYQAQGGIAVRILSRHQEEIDVAFIEQRIHAALAYRERLFPGEDVYRLIFGESDGLPGLVVDRYGETLSAESACAFYDGAIREDIVRILLALPGIRGMRMMVCGKAFTFGEVPATVSCRINGLDVAVDLAGGQKTGLFLDQRLNWVTMATFVRDAVVLDGHCYAGLWSCHAARAGARAVLGVDTSEPALELARRNAELNGYTSVCQFERADVMEVLQRGDRYDLIVLDPPAFAKSRTREAQALTLHQKMNRAAMQAIKPGGYLISASCSHFVGREAFLEMLKRSANAAQRQAWVVETRGAAPDHPILMGMPETAYLNCVILRIL